jgi:type I restriction enzyme S subunit
MSDDLPMGWVESNLKEIAQLINGDRGKNYPSKNALIDQGVPFINAGHLVDGCIDFSNMNYISNEHFQILGSGKVQKDDLIYCIRGSLGKIAIVEDVKEGAIASSLVILRPYKNTFTKYLYYFLVSPLGKSEISKHDNGTAQPNLSSANVGFYQVPIAPLNEQRRIVDKLDRIGDRQRSARNELNHIPKLIARYKQAVLAAACSGKLTENWRNEKNIEHYIQCTIANENIPIPASWTIHTFQNLFKLIDGDRGANYPKKEDYVNQGYCVFLSTKNVREYGFLFEEVVFISKEKHLSLRGGLLERQDVVITTRGTLGNVALFDENVPYELVRINSGMLILRKTNNNILGKFVILNIRSSLFAKQLQDKSSGSAQPQIPANILKAFIFPLPPLEEQKEIIRRVEEMFEKIDRMEEEYQKAAKLCDRLEQATLAKAFRGELVPQDPDDEPASVLLEQVKSERSKGKIKK